MVMLTGTSGNDNLQGGAAEFAIQLTGVSSLTATDFVL